MLTRKISLICAWKCDSEVSVESEIRCYLSLAAKGFIETKWKKGEVFITVTLTYISHVIVH